LPANHHHGPGTTVRIPTLPRHGQIVWHPSIVEQARGRARAGACVCVYMHEFCEKKFIRSLKNISCIMSDTGASYDYNYIPKFV
jgi:hypothetical protein